MLAPQSREDIQPIIDAIQRLDPLLDIRWDAEARTLRRARYDQLRGKWTSAEYDGRWQVIRHDISTAMRPERGFTVIVEITQPEWKDSPRLGRYPVPIANGPYAAVDWWLVDYLTLFDRAQAHFAIAMEEQWKEHYAAEQVADEAAAHREAAEKVYRAHAGEYWAGRGFGKGKRSTDLPQGVSS